ncbi:MAG TPA: hypothetical protein VMY34_02490 [Acidimicrobiales bacterium]|nr:hypothetical protein [Acidimicrobiales bacterium]
MAAIAAALAAAGIAVAPAPSRAGSYQASGWWYKAQTTTGSLPPPPGPVVPPGGLYVALAPDSNPSAPFGPAAISAVRFELTPGADATLTLKVAAGHRAGLPGAPYGIEACPALTTWTPVQGGSFAARPLGDCGRLRVTGLSNADATAVSFALPATWQDIDGVLDVVLSPVGRVTFETAFNAPTSESLFVFEPIGDSSGDEVATGPAASPAEPSFSPQAFAPPESPFAPGVLDTAPGADLLPAAPRPPPRSPVVARPALRRAATSVVEDRFDRATAVSLLILIGTALWWFGSQPARSPRLLGSMGSGLGSAPAPTRLAGVGRFARPRATRPRRL